MKTKKRAEFFRDCRDLLSLIHRRRPTAIPAALVTALLESAFPFVNILFGARILDRLLAGGEGGVGGVRSRGTEDDLRG